MRARKLQAPPHVNRNGRMNGLTETTGELLASGQILELVQLPRRIQPSVLLWDGGQARISSSVRVAGVSYAAAAMEPDLLRSLRLAPGIQSYPSTDHLFVETVEVLRRYGGVKEEHARKGAYFVFASHFAECLHIAPCLLIRGSSSEAVRFLQILGALCRHSLLLAGVSLDALGELPGGLRPTLLIYAPAQDRMVERLLSASNLRGFAVLGNSGLQDLFCAKAIFVGERDLPDVLVEQCLEICLSPERKSNLLWNELAETKIALELQPKFLAYRLRHLGRVSDSSFDVPQFSGPTRELARNLGACVFGDAQLQQALLALLKPQDEAIREARSTRPEAVLLEALLVPCHERGKDRVYLGELAKILNAIRQSRGETLPLAPRRLGAMLRAFGLFTQRDSKGYGFKLTTEVCRKVHELARAFDVPTVQHEHAGCAFCAEPTMSKATGDQKLVKV